MFKSVSAERLEFVSDFAEDVFYYQFRGTRSIFQNMRILARP